MHPDRLFFFVAFIFLGIRSHAQECTSLGQTPSTAFPVCGTTVFEQKQVPVCSSTSLYVPGCSGSGSANYANKNPYWYKFTCYESGTLGFVIRPKDMKDDYDWQLYDVTGRDPDEVFTNKNIIVSGNWAGNPGNTGASSSGVSYIQCASSYDGNEPRFAMMPNLIKGHEYILLVSHFTDSQSGYDLSFGGGTAVITDPAQPDLLKADYSCDGTKIYVKINKSVKCISLAADGSDFALPHSGAKVIAASAICNGFDMDSVVLQLDRSLQPGQYTVVMQKGSDGNTLIDNCGNTIPEGHFLSFEVVPLQPTPMDSLVPLQCAPDVLQLVFKKKIQCGSVAADGSDFVITGPAPVAIARAEMDCNEEGLSSVISLRLSAPMVHGGTYQVRLKRGDDGNAVLDECAQETPAGSSILFTIKDTVSADYSYQLTEGCEKDVIQFIHDGSNGVTSWQWQLDYNGKSDVQSPLTSFPPYGDKHISLIVSNGFCSDTISKIISLGLPLKAAFETNNILCPEDSATFLNQSTGSIASYTWNFGDGSTSTEQDPGPKKFPQLATEKNYPVSLIVKTPAGCTDTVSHDIRVLMTCYIAVPSAFTPNGDNLNDYLYPLNAFKADHLLFRVYNRTGQLVFESTDWTRKWDGTFRGEPQDAGVYVWTLQYTNRDTRTPVFQKGSTVLIR